MELFQLMGKIAIDNDEANRGIDETTSKAEGSQGKMSGAFKAIGAAVGTYLAVDRIVAFGQACVEAAASVAAETSAFEQIMGSYTDNAKAKVQEVADATGIVDTRLTGYMTSMTAKFKGLGYGVEEATDMAADGLTLAADASAFWDKSMDDSMSALNSFINGSYEGGEAIGLFANDTQMAAFAVSQGIVSATKDWANLDEATKQATRLEYAQNMMAQSGATGQAAKEAGQYANVQANLTEQWRQFQAVIGEPILQGIVIPAMSALNTLLSTVTPYVQQFFTGFSEGSPMLEQFAAYLEPVMEPLSQLGTTLATVLVPMFTSLWNLLVQLGSVLMSVLGPAIQTILPIITSVVEIIVATVIPAVTNIFNTVTMVLTALQPLVQTAMAFIQSIFTTVWPHIQTVVQGVMTVISSVVSTVMGVIQGIITAVMGIISGDWSAVWSGIQQVASSIWSGIQGIVEGAINIVSGIISAVLATIQSIWSGAWNAISSFLSGAWNGITSTVSGAIDGVVSFMSGLPGRILSALGNIGGLLVQAGSDLINGLSRGIMGAIDGVIGAVKGGVDRVISAAKGLLGIASPSKVFAQIGDYTMQGMEEGIEGGTPSVVRQMGRTVDSVVGAADNIAVPAPQTAYAARSHGSATEGLQGDIARLYGLLSDYLPRLLAASDTQLVLDTGELVGATATAYDERLGLIARRRARGQ